MMNKDSFIEKYQKVPVVEFENNTSNKPLVSVIVQTYQHENYIGNCLEGILSQKTTFDFEILVGEDESTDGTRRICLEYAKKHPNKIKLFLHSRENNIIVYEKPTGIFNLKYNIYNAAGKYIAFCEGDDMWVDQNKLQKQVDFLDANYNYGMVFSDIKMIDQDNNILEPTKFYKKTRLSYRSGNIFWNLLEGNFIQTLTTCFRKELVLDYLNKFPDENFMYDLRIWLHISSTSKVKFIDEVWAYYRVHDLGISHSKDFFKKRTPLVLQSGLVNYMKMTNSPIKNIVKSTFSKVVFNLVTNRNLTLKEEQPIICMIGKKPQYLFFLFEYLIGKLLEKIKQIFK